jgi:hypothetical protein
MRVETPANLTSCYGRNRVRTRPSEAFICLIRHDARRPAEADLKRLEARIERYNETIETYFEESFSIDDIGNSGSADLKAYERLDENCIAWEKMLLPENDFEAEAFIDAIVERALEAASE